MRVAHNKSSTEEFLQKLKDKGYYNTDYDYSLVDVINSKTKVIIIDKIHNTKHLITPDTLLSQGTPCGTTNAIDKNDYFFKHLKAKGHYNTDYDYSEVDVIDSTTKVIIVDKLYNTKHLIKPKSLSDGTLCCIQNTIDKNDYFFKRLKAKGYYNPDYDYSLVDVVEYGKNTIIIDKLYDTKHLISPNLLFRGTLCCTTNAIDKNNYLFKHLKAKGYYNTDYDYSLVDVINSKTKVIIIDKIHNTKHLITPDTLLSHGTLCGTKNAIDKNDYFFKRLKAKGYYNTDYDYSLVNVIGTTTKVIIVDKLYDTKHLISPSKLLSRGSRCVIENAIDKNDYFFKHLKAKGYYNPDYDYSLVDVVEYGENIIIIDKLYDTKHLMTPKALLRGTLCVSTNAIDKNDYFFKQLKAKGYYNTDYDYSEVNVIDYNKKVIIVDKLYDTKHLITPVGLLSRGTLCGTQNAIDKNDYFFKQLKAKGYYNTDYDYSLVNVIDSNNTKIKIICKTHGVFEQTPSSHKAGHGCPVCNKGFTKSYKLALINEIVNSDLESMDSLELLTIIQQGNLPNDFKELISSEPNSEERLVTINELKKKIENNIENNEETEITDSPIIDGEFLVNESENDIEDITNTSTSTNTNISKSLPVINSLETLHSLDNKVYVGMDDEVYESLIQYKLRKLWNNVLNINQSIDGIRKETGGKYFTSIKDQFIDEYDSVTNLKTPIGYNIKEFQPNLMQKLTVYRLMKNKHYGNWSGTGAGKTLSFILASRALESKLTVVIALNSTIKQTCLAIKEAYPDSVCFTKYEYEYENDYIFDRKNNNYLVLNFEKFQQKNSEENFQSLTTNNKIDFIVIDEVHNVKQREPEEESIRRGVMSRLLGRAREDNKDLHVLAMSATPVINNLQEAKSLLTLMSGLDYEDLDTKRSIHNAIKVFQQLTLNGIRYIPKYDIEIEQIPIDIDGSHLLDDLLDIKAKSYIDVEKLLLKDKLKAVEPYIRKGTIIYSYFTTDFINNIEECVKTLGLTYGTYTGNEGTLTRERNLRDFISGKIDVLIGSRPIGTGVDGLQKVANRLIPITLPWTDSEFTQLKGRVYRQGSAFSNIDIIIPQISINTDDGIWSWDKQRLNLIRNKRTLADAAVDGVIPSRIIPSKDTMFKNSIKSLKLWKSRVSTNLYVPHRTSIEINLYPEITDIEKRKEIINSELSEFNRIGKITKSSTMHKEFKDNPESWKRYHSLRKSRMDLWDEIPYEHIATKITNSDDILADFGCGENLFKGCVTNKVHSFDHVAIDDSVTACDMSNTGLEDGSIDIAIFSLALWGTNFEDYIKEAYRVISKRGLIYIAEPSKSYKDEISRDKLVNMLLENGFNKLGDIEDRGKFFYITVIKQ